MKRKSLVVTLSVSLGLVIAGLITALVVFIVTTTTYSTQLENIYKRSFYELSSNINDIEIDISKLIATTDSEVQLQILTDIYSTCTIANLNISNLPVSNNNIHNITAFINKLNGFSYSLITKINSNTTWSQEDVTSIGELHTHSLNLYYEFNNYLENLSFDYTILNQVNYKDSTSGLNETFNNIQTTSSQVPSLIYDGPFAESVLNPEILGLPQEQVTRAYARTYIEQNFSMYEIENIRFINETNGLFQTYNFEVKCKKVTLYAQITKRGGHLLEITSIGKGGKNNLTATQGENLAKNFALNLGFNDMYSVWSTVNGDIAYVNLAPIEGGVIYYSDLIKVKVDRKLGVVTGWEARSYFYNHTTRNLPTPTITLNEGQEKLSSLLSVKERNVALIPIEYGQEKLSYEYICTWKSYVYYIYLDVNTGEELNILRVIKTSSGNLMM